MGQVATSQYSDWCRKNKSTLPIVSKKLCIPHTLYAYHHKKEMNGSEAGGFLKMFELEHSSKVSVISYQVHVMLQFSKTAALFSERL